MYLHVLKAAQLCDHSAARFCGPIPQLGSQFGVLYCLPSCCTFFSDAAEGCSDWSQLLVICKQPSSEATQYFSVRRERRESAMFSGIWKLLTLTLSPLHCTKFVLEDWNKTHWRKLRNFYNVRKPSVRPKEQGYMVACLLQFSSVHSGRLSNPITHIKWP